MRAMYEPLQPCPACRRHVRHLEPACPFCGAALAATPAPAPRAEGPRLSRSAMLLLGSAALAEACKQPQVAAVYGAPPTPAATADASPRPAPRPSPPPSPPDDPGGGAEVYGAPPPPPRPDGGGQK